MKIVKKIFLIQNLIFIFSIAYPAKHYIGTTGNNSYPGTINKPYKTFAYAYTKMHGGDTLIIKDGEYSEAIYSYYDQGFPAGSAGAYTVIKAEHDWHVRVTEPLRIAGDNIGYIHIQGIHFTVNTIGIGGHHMKFIRCSFRGDICDDNTTVIAAGTGSSYILFEECFAYGCGRYKFMAYGDQNVLTEKIIFRRCVSRHDYHNPNTNWGQQCATFTSYDCHDFLMQNCISINSGDDNPLTYGMLYGGAWFENKETTPGDNSACLQGCIFLNLAGLAAINDPKNNGTRSIENCVICDSKGGYSGAKISGNPSLLLNHLTIRDIWGSFQDQSYAWGTGVYADEGFVNEKITNSIITNCNSYGIADYINSDYNNYYGNDKNFGNTYNTPTPVSGINDKFVKPDLKYLCRVEEGSPLKGAASDGSDIGATIINRYGVSGTLWGEPGFDSLINEPLWPFPNEDVIKTEMSTWDYINDGKRGFCTNDNSLTGQPITLTSYIWEYLGYPCPPEICMSASTGINSLINFPSDLELYQNSPNPFNNSTSILVEIPETGWYKLKIYDFTGREVKVLNDKILTPGSYQIEWNGTNNTGQQVENGIYYYQLQTSNNIIETKNMLFLR